MNQSAETEASSAKPASPETGPLLRRVRDRGRAALLWGMTLLHFFTVCPVLILIGTFIDPRKNDWPQRMLSRNVVRFAGATLEVHRSPGFDPHRTCFIVSNHVNMFDPFVLYSSVPQFFRGLELESHFRIPVYGWMMKRFGNVPVPDNNAPSDLKRMWRMTRSALDSGVSLVIFPEGGRTITGRVEEFRDGAFRMAQQFGAAITPVSIVGAFEWNTKLSRMLRPAKVTVYLHDTIETKGLRKEDVAQLRDRVWNIVASPVHAAMIAAREKPASTPDAAETPQISG